MPGFGRFEQCVAGSYAESSIGWEIRRSAGLSATCDGTAGSRMIARAGAATRRVASSARGRTRDGRTKSASAAGRWA